MSIKTDSQCFERMAQRRGKLLRAEADREGPTPTQLVLTFDLGRILIQPKDDTLVTKVAEERDELPGGLVGLDEEDPWWRLLGAPLAAVTVEAAGETSDAFFAIRLQFREDADNPRFVTLQSAGAAMRVRLEG